jgi:hypothetical protein
MDEEIRKLSDLGLGGLPPIRRRLMIRQIARAANVNESVVQAALRTGRGQQRQRPIHDHPADIEAMNEHGFDPSGMDPYEETNWKPNAREQLLGCLLTDANLWLLMGSAERELTRTTAFGSPHSQMVAEAFQLSVEHGTGTSLHAVLNELAEMSAETGKNMIDAEQRATMLCQMVARDSEGLDARVTRLFNECIAAVSIEDQRAGFANAQNQSNTQSEEPNDKSEADKLKAFIEAQRASREKFGRSGKTWLSGD